MPQPIASGKVREIYEIGQDKLLIAVSDRISAYDVIMPEPVPDKGKILNQMSIFWTRYVADLVPNHMIATELPDFPAEFQTAEFEGRSILVKKLKMLPIECIVRGYITGSGWADYQRTGTICGAPLPAGMRESEKFPEPLFTPSTKAAMGQHDENVSFERAAELLGGDLAERVRAVTIAIYKKCARYALSRGIILADTKFEFGLDESGALVLADEVLTPDSSRFWPLEGYEVGRGQQSFDKQYLRDWLTENGLRGKAPAALPPEVIARTRAKYVEAYELLTGKAFA
ncbi:MAG: phosphoribosylaminoimidazolesuccinocarboxamide synthase [Oscillospiraceae bacterium]|jgi:phosphoribosylaminoimidazole-succinocarboxamide synthase|nr:phosphoribosylaminoimidazolesuccinocarboxamide synthase [Oscillospiraceae bacterium]